MGRLYERDLSEPFVPPAPAGSSRVSASLDRRRGAWHGHPTDPPFPPRDGCRVAPLIEAAEMFPALEAMVLAARHQVHLAFRVFDPATITRSSEARALGLVDWAAILGHVAAAGVTVRLLLSDFEPVIAHDLHGGSWDTFRQLRAVGDALGAPARARLQVIVIQHEGELGWSWRQLLRLPVAIAARRAVAELAARADGADALAARPGLWRHQGNGFFARLSPPPRLWPATYHQKFAVADDAHAIVGGLDVDERRWDTRHHRRRADQTWHDISVALEGPAVTDAAAHFARLWNAEAPRFRSIVGEWTRGHPVPPALEPLDEMPTPVEVARAPAGAARAQWLRTQSKRDPSPFAIGPMAHVRELEAAHRRLIMSATRVLYIEAQFFRFQPAASWIIARGRARPELQVIVVLPNAPEEVAFDGDKRAPHRHGEWLQWKALSRLQRKLPGRVGLFSLAKPAPASAAERELTADRGTAFGAGSIHVHAKLLVADTSAALCSSANINGRSFRWDTECGVAWTDADGIAAFRARLWSQLLDRPLVDVADPIDALALWQSAANENIRADPEDRRGFIVPHRLTRAGRFARPSWFVPDDLV